jgi:hypothetical protein
LTQSSSGRSSQVWLQFCGTRLRGHEARQSLLSVVLLSEDDGDSSMPCRAVAASIFGPTSRTRSAPGSCTRTRGAPSGRTRTS